MLVIAGLIIGIISPITYIVSITRGTSKPHRTTRFVFLFVVLLNLFGTIADHGNFGSIAIDTLFVIQSVVIFAMSLKRGMGGMSPFDIICLILAVIGLVAWQVSGNASYGIALSIGAGIIAYIPAYIKTWKRPETESPWLYITGGLASVMTLFGYSISATSSFQIYNAAICVGMLVCIYKTKVYPFSKSA
ncbi:MAG: hypothetical protein JWM81_818 [Candidatus Saccharibacteria bacterium]|nr:hypothetical protein [Candidatus Saccharibacteria bacterium]